MNRPSWTKDFSKRKGGKEMHPFNFKKFFETNKGLTIEQFAEDIGYSLTGVYAMISRGTVKPTVLKSIKELYTLRREIWVA